MKTTCADWLRTFLIQNGDVLSDNVREEAKARGYTRGELKDARRVLCVKTFHQFDEEGATPNYFWYLEEQNG